MGTQPDPAELEFEARVAVLRRTYVEGLPARNKALIDAWRACADGSGDAAWLDLREVAHKLAGSAASYGFDALGEAAREVDRLLSGRSPCRDRAQAQAAVERLLAALLAASAGG